MNKQRFTAALDLIGVLAERFPQCFVVFDQRRKPLKIGIREELVTALDGAITAKELFAALRLYCSNAHYLRASTEGAIRVDLNGEAAGQVTADEADNAAQRLAQQNAKQARRQETQAKTKAKAEDKARNAGRVSAWPICGEQHRRDRQRCNDPMTESSSGEARGGGGLETVKVGAQGQKRRPPKRP